MLKQLEARLAPISKAILAHRYWWAMPFLAPGFAIANPTGADVQSGSVAFTNPDANTLRVDQATSSASINWQSFSVQSNEYVIFNQPSASAVVLNRVIGGTPSEIFGHLMANGRVFLINPSGVLFGPGSQIDVGALVASTMDLSEENFKAGRYVFTGNGSTASVANAGTITAGAGGFVVLTGDYVQNSGLIQAQLGQVVLASGSAITLDLNGDGLISYTIDQAAFSDRAGVENLGQIIADGGRVVMAAQVARSLLATVVNNEGLVRAQSIVEGEYGEIILAGAGGDIVNSGTLDASGANGNDGGVIRIKGDGKTRLTDTSRVLATGDGPNAKGGFVEVSGKTVSVRGSLQIGKGGTFLLDPSDAIIGNGTGAGCAASFCEGSIESLLRQGTNVQVVASNSITLQNLTDDVLDGLGTGAYAGGGGDLLLGIGTIGGSPSYAFTRGPGVTTGDITFSDANDTIRVDGNLALIAGFAYGDITVGGLTAGNALNLVAANNITAGNLTAVSYASISAAYGNIDLDDITVTQAGGVLGTARLHLTANGDGSLTGHIDADTISISNTTYRASLDAYAAGDILINQLNVQGGGGSGVSYGYGSINVSDLARVDAYAGRNLTIHGANITAAPFQFEGHFSSVYGGSDFYGSTAGALINLTAGNDLTLGDTGVFAVTGYGDGAVDMLLLAGNNITLHDIVLTSKPALSNGTFTFGSTYGNGYGSSYTSYATLDFNASAGNDFVIDAYGDVTLNGNAFVTVNAFAGRDIRVDGALNVSATGGDHFRTSNSTSFSGDIFHSDEALSNYGEVSMFLGASDDFTLGATGAISVNVSGNGFLNIGASDLGTDGTHGVVLNGAIDMVSTPRFENRNFSRTIPGSPSPTLASFSSSYAQHGAANLSVNAFGSYADVAVGPNASLTVSGYGGVSFRGKGVATETALVGDQIGFFLPAASVQLRAGQDVIVSGDITATGHLGTSHQASSSNGRPSLHDNSFGSAGVIINAGRDAVLNSAAAVQVQGYGGAFFGMSAGRDVLAYGDANVTGLAGDFFSSFYGFFNSSSSSHQINTAQAAFAGVFLDAAHKVTVASTALINVNAQGDAFFSASASSFGTQGIGSHGVEVAGTVNVATTPGHFTFNNQRHTNVSQVPILASSVDAYAYSGIAEVFINAAGSYGDVIIAPTATLAVSGYGGNGFGSYGPSVGSSPAAQVQLSAGRDVLVDGAITIAGHATAHHEDGINNGLPFDRDGFFGNARLGVNAGRDAVVSPATPITVHADGYGSVDLFASRDLSVDGGLNVTVYAGTFHDSFTSFFNNRHENNTAYGGIADVSLVAGRKVTVGPGGVTVNAPGFVHFLASAQNFASTSTSAYGVEVNGAINLSATRANLSSSSFSSGGNSSFFFSHTEFNTSSYGEVDATLWANTGNVILNGALTATAPGFVDITLQAFQGDVTVNNTLNVAATGGDHYGSHTNSFTSTFSSSIQSGDETASHYAEANVIISAGDDFALTSYGAISVNASGDATVRITAFDSGTDNVHGVGLDGAIGITTTPLSWTRHSSRFTPGTPPTLTFSSSSHSERGIADLTVNAFGAYGDIAIGSGAAINVSGYGGGFTYGEGFSQAKDVIVIGFVTPAAAVRLNTGGDVTVGGGITVTGHAGALSFSRNFTNRFSSGVSHPGGASIGINASGDVALNAGLTATGDGSAFIGVNAHAITVDAPVTATANRTVSQFDSGSSFFSSFSSSFFRLGRVGPGQRQITNHSQFDGGFAGVNLSAFRGSSSGANITVNDAIAVTGYGDAVLDISANQDVAISAPLSVTAFAADFSSAGTLTNDNATNNVHETNAFTSSGAFGSASASLFAGNDITIAQTGSLTVTGNGRASADFFAGNDVTLNGGVTLLALRGISNDTFTSSFASTNSAGIRYRSQYFSDSFSSSGFANLDISASRNVNFNAAANVDGYGGAQVNVFAGNDINVNAPVNTTDHGSRFIYSSHFSSNSYAPPASGSGFGPLLSHYDSTYNSSGTSGFASFNANAGNNFVVTNTGGVHVLAPSFAAARVTAANNITVDGPVTVTATPNRYHSDSSSNFAGYGAFNSDSHYQYTSDSASGFAFLRMDAGNDVSLGATGTVDVHGAGVAEVILTGNNITLTGPVVLMATAGIEHSTSSFRFNSSYAGPPATSFHRASNSFSNSTSGFALLQATARNDLTVGAGGVHITAAGFAEALLTASNDIHLGGALTVNTTLNHFSSASHSQGYGMNASGVAFQFASSSGETEESGGVYAQLIAGHNIDVSSYGSISLQGYGGVTLYGSAGQDILAQGPINVTAFASNSTSFENSTSTSGAFHQTSNSFSSSHFGNANVTLIARRGGVTVDGAITMTASGDASLFLEGGISSGGTGSNFDATVNGPIQITTRPGTFRDSFSRFSGTTNNFSSSASLSYGASGDINVFMLSGLGNVTLGAGGLTAETYGGDITLQMVANNGQVTTASPISLRARPESDFSHFQRNDVGSFSSFFSDSSGSHQSSVFVNLTGGTGVTLGAAGLNIQNDGGSIYVTANAPNGAVTVNGPVTLAAKPGTFHSHFFTSSSDFGFFSSLATDSSGSSGRVYATFSGYGGVTLNGAVTEEGYGSVSLNLNSQNGGITVNGPVSLTAHAATFHFASNSTSGSTEGFFASSQFASNSTAGNAYFSAFARNDVALNGAVTEAADGDVSLFVTSQTGGVTVDGAVTLTANPGVYHSSSHRLFDPSGAAFTSSDRAADAVFGDVDLSLSAFGDVLLNSNLTATAHGGINVNMVGGAFFFNGSTFVQGTGGVSIAGPVSLSAQAGTLHTDRTYHTTSFGGGTFNSFSSLNVTSGSVDASLSGYGGVDLASGIALSAPGGVALDIQSTTGNVTVNGNVSVVSQGGTFNFQSSSSSGVGGVPSFTSTSAGAGNVGPAHLSLLAFSGSVTAGDILVEGFGSATANIQGATVNVGNVTVRSHDGAAFFSYGSFGSKVIGGSSIQNFAELTLDDLTSYGAQASSVLIQGGDILIGGHMTLTGGFTALATHSIGVLPSFAFNRPTEITAHGMGFAVTGSFDAYGVAYGSIDLSGATLNIQTGEAPFGSDALANLVILVIAPSLEPSSATPNAAFAAAHVTLGNLNFQDDASGQANYVFVQSNTLDYTGTVTAPNNIFVRYAPFTTDATIHIVNDLSGITQVQGEAYYDVNDFNPYPATTFAFGSTYNFSNVFIGEDGTDVTLPDAENFVFLTNASVFFDSSLKTGGAIEIIQPLVILAALTQRPVVDQFEAPESAATTAEEEEKQDVEDKTAAGEVPPSESDSEVTQETSQELECS